MYIADEEELDVIINTTCSKEDREFFHRWRSIARSYTEFNNNFIEDVATLPDNGLPTDLAFRTLVTNVITRTNKY